MNAELVTTLTLDASDPDLVFRDGETPWTWAERVVRERATATWQGEPARYVRWAITNVSIYCSAFEVADLGGGQRGTIPGRITATIELRGDV